LITARCVPTGFAGYRSAPLRRMAPVLFFSLILLSTLLPRQANAEIATATILTAIATASTVLSTLISLFDTGASPYGELTAQNREMLVRLHDRLNVQETALAVIAKKVNDLPGEIRNEIDNALRNQNIRNFRAILNTILDDITILKLLNTEKKHNDPVNQTPIADLSARLHDLQIAIGNLLQEEDDLVVFELFAARPVERALILMQGGAESKVDWAVREKKYHNRLAKVLGSRSKNSLWSRKEKARAGFSDLHGRLIRDIIQFGTELYVWKYADSAGRESEIIRYDANAKEWMYSSSSRAEKCESYTVECEKRLRMTEWNFSPGYCRFLPGVLAMYENNQQCKLVLRSQHIGTTTNEMFPQNWPFNIGGWFYADDWASGLSASLPEIKQEFASRLDFMRKDVQKKVSGLLDYYLLLKVYQRLFCAVVVELEVIVSKTECSLHESHYETYYQKSAVKLWQQFESVVSQVVYCRPLTLVLDRECPRLGDVEYWTGYYENWLDLVAVARRYNFFTSVDRHTSECLTGFERNISRQSLRPGASLTPAGCW